MADEPTPFTLSVPDSALADLHKRLELTRFPTELAGAGHARGPPLADLTRLVARWRDGYDWRRREAQINALPMFTRPLAVEGFGTLDVHFVHKRSAVTGAIPLLFVHGWPGHFLEVEKLLPLLTSPSSEYPSFHVVAPSLPGFGFSEAPNKVGFGLDQYAEILDKLMLSLGYNKYVTQGGDWGALITQIMAACFGDKSVQAAHSNMPLGQPLSPLKNPIYFLQMLLSQTTAVGQARTNATQGFMKECMGYNKQQSTRPQTIGYALTDTPAGLLAWIYEKLLEWTDAYPWEDDEVLDWISVYWFSRAGPAAAGQIYYERQHADLTSSKRYVSVPFGISLFPKELVQLPLPMIRAAHNVVFEGEHAHGGHFAAYEQPLALAGDLRKMFGRGGPAFGVVAGHDGF